MAGYLSSCKYLLIVDGYIKIAIDKGAAPGSFWLTGSQAFKLMTLAQESLAGRVALLHLSSLSQHELYGKGSLQPFSVSADKLMERQTKSEKATFQAQLAIFWLFRRLLRHQLLWNEYSTFDLPCRCNS